MKFTAGPEAYDRSVGRYSRELAPLFAEFAGVGRFPGGAVLDVGCGPGALTYWLARRVGAASVCAVDPNEPFAAVCRERVPGADVRIGRAEALPFGDGTFVGALSQLVLSFVPRAARAAAEMVRVVRPGGVVAACTFERDGFALARHFWASARRFDPEAPDDARLPFRTSGELIALFGEAGLHDLRTATISFEVDYDRLDDLWSMFSDGVGPTGEYFVAQSEERRAAIRDAYYELLGRPARGFSLPAQVVAVRGLV